MHAISGKITHFYMVHAVAEQEKPGEEFDLIFVSVHSKVC